MDIQRWEQIKKLLDAALEAPAEQRQSVLRQVMDENPTLAYEVLSLLEFEEEAGDFLEKPLQPRLDSASQEEEFTAGSRLGPYEIVRLIGRGGMGEVYLASRVDDFKRQVALKVIRRGLRRRDLIRRFENERQILARLDAPYIARLLDGGTTPEGLPYLVMDYIDGEPLDAYAKNNRLSTRERIALFRKICSAFETLHRHLIVHRDLKPQNILITRTGEPRLLDFGIAKLLQPTPSDLLFDTQLGPHPLTPIYASPEQVRNEPITTSSDIYSLGVLLYELLTGNLPYRVASTDLGALFHEICEIEPVKPSSAIRQQSSGADFNGDRARRKARELAGDLDSIVLKTLQKRPEQRYGSIEQLSEDLRRYLEGLPVRAREGTVFYRMEKFVRRRKVAVAALAAIVVLSTYSFLLWRQAARERDLAVRERQRAEEVASFLEGVFQEAKPDISTGHEITLREALDRGRNGLRQAKIEPGLRADLVATLADVYRDLGSYEESEKLFGQAVALRRQDPRNDLGLLAKELSNLAGVEYLVGALDKAEEHLREAFQLRLRLGQSGDDLVITQNNLASTLAFRGAFEEADSLYRSGLAIRQQLHGPDSVEVASSLYNLGALAFLRGDLEQAETLLRRALMIRQRELGPDHTQVAAVLDTLGRTLQARGDLAGAEAIFRRALAIRQQRLGEDHPDVAASKRDLASVLLDLGKLSAVESLLTEALAVHREHTPDGQFWIATAESILGDYYAACGRDREAEELLLRSYRAILRSRGSRCIYTRQAAQRLFRFYERRGRRDRAEEVLRGRGKLYRVSGGGRVGSGLP